MSRPTATLCTGSHCQRKQADAYYDLQRRLTKAGVEVAEARCLGLCSGPTAVLEVDGQVVCFDRLRKPKVQRDLVALAERAVAEPTVRLARRAVSGGDLRKVTARLDRRRR